jgi:hypothetical protein
MALDPLVELEKLRRIAADRWLTILRLEHELTVARALLAVERRRGERFRTPDIAPRR